MADELLDGDEGGKGGTSRGPGAAKLEFGDESSAEGAKFKEEMLPPSEAIVPCSSREMLRAADRLVLTACGRARRTTWRRASPPLWWR